MTNKKDLEIYIHIPFCARKCGYCDFLSFPGNLRMQHEYADKLTEEIRCQGQVFRDYRVVTVFIGGGTPSILEEGRMSGILGALRESFEICREAEITIEANPGTLSMEKLRSYREAGVNRISLGLQSADNGELRLLGRIHTYDEFLKSYQRALMCGFSNINVDLMSALPGQTLESWKNTLKKVTRLKPEHISAYSLIIEEGTPYYERYGGNGESPRPRGRFAPNALPDLPDEDTEREMYYLTRSFLKEMGYERYEISNYAKPGFACRHNMGYWKGVEYLGLGLGASSCAKGYRFHNERDLNVYLKAHLGEERQFEQTLRQEAECQTLKSRMEEFMFLGLRLTEGVSQEEFASRLGYNIWDVYGDKILLMVGKGLMEAEGGFIRLTKKGIDVSNYVMSEFLMD